MWFLLTISAVWPGWMSYTDAYFNWREAVSGQYSTWHPLAPKLVWRLLRPEQWGPRGPVLLQYITFAVGFTLVLIWAQRRAVWAAWMGLGIVVISSFTWNLAWVLSDGWILGLLSLSTGLVLMAQDHGRISRPGMLLAGAGIGASALARSYMFVAILAWGAILLLVVAASRRLAQLVMLVATAVATFGAGIIVTAGMTSVENYPASSVMFFDLARAECSTRAVEQATPSQGSIPRGFIVGGEMRDICDLYDSSRWDPLRWNDPGETYLRLPATDSEFRELAGRWTSQMIRSPSIYVSARVEMFFRLATKTADPRFVPIPTKERLSVGGMSSNEKVNPLEPVETRFPSLGGLPLALAALPGSIVSNVSVGLTSAILLILVAPVLAFWRFSRRASAQVKAGPALLALAPTVYLVTVALVAPADEARYTGPAQFMGLVATIVLLSLRSGLAQREEQLTPDSPSVPPTSPRGRDSTRDDAR